MISICVKVGSIQQSFCFEKSEITLGRAEENDLVLDDKRVSKRHCRIIALKTKFYLLDTNSTNGSYINRTRVSSGQSIPIGAYDEVRIGDHFLWLTLELAQTQQNTSPHGAERLWQRAAAPPFLAAAEEEDLQARGPATTQSRIQPLPAELRQLIAQVLPCDSDFEGFCLDHFREIKKQFTSSMERTTKVNILLERADLWILQQLLYSELDIKRIGAAGSGRTARIGASSRPKNFL